VSFDRPLRVPQIASVLVDNGGGAKRGTQHLIEHGHKRIHFLGNAPHLFTIQRRFDGYRRALSNAGLKAQECLDCNSEELVLSYAKKVMGGKDTPTAFFCGNNQISRYLYRALFHLRLQVPGDVAVVGFDDFDMADMLYPPLTVIRQPVETLGKTAAEVLFARLKTNVDDWPTDTSRTTLNVELMLRTSCGCKSASTTKNVAIK
jgi:LacI family transcriptional regulator